MTQHLKYFAKFKGEFSGNNFNKKRSKTTNK